jgi:16S rRNA processing protein RimM
MPEPAEVLPDDLIAVGRVVDAYGTRGWVKVEPYNSPQESVLHACRRWWLPDGRSVVVQSARQHGAVLACKPANCADRDQALAFKGLEIRASRADFPSAGADEFYWVDLVGCQVVNREGVDLGRVESVVDHGAHPILVLAAEGGEQRMIPFVDAFVDDVDLAGRRIVADWQPDY